jgi:FkbM family methyltransferase
VKLFADLNSAQGLGWFRYGWTDPDVDLLASLLEPGDAFIDGGANVGLFSLACGLAVGSSGCGIAVEPSHATFGRLVRHLDANRLHWVQAIPAALGRTGGVVTFHAFSGNGAGTSGLVPSRDGAQELKVPMITLDQLSEAVDRPVRLVKLDLEGAEFEALSGAKRLLEQRTMFFIEAEETHLARMGSSVEAVFGLLRAHGYGLFQRSSGGTLVPFTQVRDLERNPNVLAVADRDWLTHRGFLASHPDSR